MDEAVFHPFTSTNSSKPSPPPSKPQKPPTRRNRPPGTPTPRNRPPGPPTRQNVPPAPQPFNPTPSLTRDSSSNLNLAVTAIQHAHQSSSSRRQSASQREGRRTPEPRSQDLPQPSKSPATLPENPKGVTFPPVRVDPDALRRRPDAPGLPGPPGRNMCTSAA
ncbi:serine/arginine repetitive matrix protein 1-like [Harmonia axyridis]|uniref:serine/arginine repetitive matrix protein 1-like n=1 Tax=Harmonia axyridis TaxID=115357 RepID=UPI001E276FA6|nr:serine/arginine repetitive matrix protein 1-like [Harmonia axyridis]